MRLKTNINDNLELRVDLLKERIYATLALLAVLVSIDPSHTTSARAAILVGGTAFSLWLASQVASQMSYRIVMQEPVKDTHHLHLQSIQHAPLLYAAVFPVFIIAISETGLYGLSVALDIAIGSSALLMLGWSLLSARAMKARQLTTLLIAASELLIGLAIVFIKIKISH